MHNQHFVVFSLQLLLFMGTLRPWLHQFDPSLLTRFATASLYYMDIQGNWVKVPRSWMMWSLLVGVGLLLTVNIELMLRSIISFLGGGELLRPIPGHQSAGADV